MLKNPIGVLFRRVAAARSLSATASVAPSLPSSETEKTVEKGEPKLWKPLYRRLSALGGAPEGSVEKTLNKWLREGRTVKAVQLMKYVIELRKYKRHKHALELMDWMVKTKGMNMSYTNHAIRLDLISKVRGVESAEEYFSSLPESAKNQRTYGALLSCYCSAKMADKASAIHKKMNELNFSSTLVYNNLMSLYMKLGQPEKVISQFQEMKVKNIVPDNVTCCILMSSHAALNDIDSVETVVKEMEEGEEVTLHWTAYSSLASIYTSSGLITKAECALKKLELLKDSRDREPLHFLISLYAGTGNLAEVKRVWKSLKSSFQKTINVSYLTMLQALNKLDDVDGMKQIYGEWESGYVTYDVKLTNVMIGAYLRNNLADKAQAIWEKALEKGAVPDSRTCELFLDYYLKNCKVGLALNWLEMATTVLKQDKWKLGHDKMTMFSKCIKEAKDVEGEERFCKCLERLKLS